MILYLVSSVPLYCLIRQALELFTFFGRKYLPFKHIFSLLDWRTTIYLSTASLREGFQRERKPPDAS